MTDQTEEPTVREDVIELLVAAGFEVRDAEHQFAVTGSIDTAAILIEQVIQHCKDSMPYVWNDVDESQPQHDQRVLVLFWPYNNRENQQIVGEATYWDGSFYTHEADDHHPPSHWMPMPPLPEVAT